MERYSVQSIRDLVPVEDCLRLGLACTAITNGGFLAPGEYVGSGNTSVLRSSRSFPEPDPSVVEALRVLAVSLGADMVELGRGSGQFVLLPAED